MSAIVESRDQRRRRLGIDCVGCVEWRQWEPCREYVKKIRIKNVDARPQTINYTQALRKDIFFMGFPEPVTLSSGMSFDIEVRYRPVHVAELHDMIKVTVVGRGSFLLRLECKTPYAMLQVPSHHDFTYTAVGSTAAHTVTMKNTGTVAVEFAWEVLDPFAISPASGVLEEGKSISLELSFAPREACALVAQLVCWRVGTDEVVACMKLSGVGKYPFIRVANTAMGQKDVGMTRAENSLLVDFGNQLVNTTRYREFELQNPSMVDAVFGLDVADNQYARHFTVTPKSGVIERGKSQKFKVVFAPTVPGNVYVGSFRVVTTTGNTVLARVLGASPSPVVRTSTTAIDFGDVRLNDAVFGAHANEQPVFQRFFLIKNFSEAALSFFFMSIFPGAAFVVDPISGELPAKGSVRVKVEFCPTHPINYLRRLLILVKNTDSLLYVDVFGSAYNSSIRPSPFNAKDVGAFFQRHECGLAGARPSDLPFITETLRAGGGCEDFMRLMSSKGDVGLAGLQEQKDWRCSNRNMTKNKHKGVARLDFSHLINPFSATAPFSLVTDSLLFANDSHEPQHVTVHNRTDVPATAYWCVPDGSPFSVTPMQEDVPPCSFCTFTVAITGNVLSYVVDHFLECYVNFKQMRSFRLVDEGSFTPPHFFVLRCQQEVTSSVADAGTVAPFVRAPKSVIFPTSRSGDTVHSVIYLENQSGLSTMFDISAHFNLVDSQNGPLRDDTVVTQRPVFCYPDKGLIPPNKTVPVLLSFQPTGAARFLGKAFIRLNKSLKDEIEVFLVAESFLPELIVEDSSKIVLRPTCVTGEICRRLKIVNPTPMSLAFDVSPSHELLDVLRVTPALGILDAGKQMELMLFFAPREAQMYEGHINFLISFSDDVIRLAPSGSNVDCGLGDRRKLISCPCVGEGRYAVVEVEPVTMEHEGPAMHKTTFEWTIYNSGLCDVCYEVRWVPGSNAAREQEDQHKTQPVQLCCNMKGTLAARSHTVVLITLQPPAGVSDYILYALVGGSGVNFNAIPHLTTLDEVRQHPHCEVRLKGTRPAIQITDVRSIEQCRSQLWCQLRINSVNTVLATPVQEKDLETDSFAFLQYIRGLEPIFMDLGVGSVLHGKKEILLCVENSGMCPASFRFWYPTEHEGGNETWYLNDEELEDVQQILFDRLIDISPREGTIPVGSRKVITITYLHTVVGTHCLPVLLRLDEGKKALLVLEARTVLPDANALAFHHPSVYRLHPVALGDLEPPLQTTTIENTAFSEVRYIVQEDLAQQVAEKNCGFPVFQCLNSTGTIPPGSSVQLNWYFRPLEARTYCIDVLLQTVGGEEYSLQFVGVGYHPKKVTKEAARDMINNAFLFIPISPSLRLPVERCPVVLSMDVMRVGVAPTFSLHRRICYLENRHPRHAYSFLWDTKLAPGSSTLKVTPPAGVLGPGKKMRCVFTLHCGSLSQIIETSVFCRVRREATEAPAPAAAAGKLQLVGSDAVAVKGEIYDDPLLDAKTPPKKEFTRSTCTKLRPPGEKRKRLPLAAPVHACYQTAHGAAGSVAAALVPLTTTTTAAAGAASQAHFFSKSLQSDQGGLSTTHSLEIFVQARVMPIEEYERLYGKLALHQMHFPTFNQIFTDSRATFQANNQRADGAGAYCSEQLEVARRILEDLLRAVIARPLVSEAFTEPRKGRILFYRDIVDTSFEPASVGVSGFSNRFDLMFDGAGQSQECLSISGAAEEDADKKPLHDSSAMKETRAQKGKTRAVLRRECATTNLIEELVADVTMQAVGEVMDNLQKHQDRAFSKVKD